MVRSKHANLCDVSNKGPQMLAGLSGREIPFPSLSTSFPCFSIGTSYFFVLDSPVRKNACTRPGGPGQWKGETAPKHIWQLSQSLAGEMVAGTRTGTKHEQEHSGQHKSSNRNRNRMPGWQDIEQAAAIYWPKTARQGSDTWAGSVDIWRS